MERLPLFPNPHQIPIALLDQDISVLHLDQYKNLGARLENLLGYRYGEKNHAFKMWQAITLAPQDILLTVNVGEKLLNFFQDRLQSVGLQLNSFPELRDALLRLTEKKVINGASNWVEYLSLLSVENQEDSWLDSNLSHLVEAGFPIFVNTAVSLIEAPASGYEAYTIKFGKMPIAELPLEDHERRILIAGGVMTVQDLIWFLSLSDTPYPNLQDALRTYIKTK